MENHGDIPLQKVRRRRVVLFPTPLQGHINPMLQLASILYNRGGFSITMIHTNFNSPNPSNYPHFDFRSIRDDLSESEISTLDAVSLTVLLNDRCVVPLQDCLVELLARRGEDDDSVACLITDAAWCFTQAVADNLKIQRIVLRTSNICSFNVFAAVPFLFEKGYLPIQGIVRFFNFW